MPLPGTTVFHARYSERNRLTATLTLDGDCVITRATTEGVTDPNGTWYPGDRDVIYAGPVRVIPYIPTRGEKRLIAGEGEVTQRGYRITVRYDVAEIMVGDLVEITRAVDATLVGLKMRITDVKYGTEQWQRNLLANEVIPGT